MGKLNILNRYAVIPNSILNNTRLSFKAKGLYAYIQSKPDDWNFSVENIAAQAKEGVESIRGGITELEEFGLLTRKKFQVEKGHWDIEYILHEVTVIEDIKSPTPENPTSGNPSQENPRLENPAPDFPPQENRPNNSKKEVSNNLSNTEVLPDDSEKSSVDFVQVEVEEVIPPEISESSAPAAAVKKPAKSRRKDPSEYTIVTKIKIAVYEMNKDYRWNGTDGSAAKKLAASIKEVWVKNTGMEPTDEEILKYFRKMIPFIPKYWDGIWDVKGLNSEFNKISSAMKKPVSNGKTIDAMIEIRQISEKRLREGRVKTFNDQ